MSKQIYLQVFISFKNIQQGMAPVRALMDERLAFGGTIFSGPAKSLSGKIRLLNRITFI